MAKNPFMSAYLSAANKVANTARGAAMNEGRRQVRKQNTAATNAWLDLAPAPLGAGPPTAAPAPASTDAGTEERTRRIAAAAAAGLVVVVLLAGMSALLIYADIVRPVNLFG